MIQTPAHKFISELDAYIDACIEKRILQVQRMPAAQRESQDVALGAVCERGRADLLTALTSMMRDAKRPGI